MRKLIVLLAASALAACSSSSSTSTSSSGSTGATTAGTATTSATSSSGGTTSGSSTTTGSTTSTGGSTTTGSTTATGSTTTTGGSGLTLSGAATIPVNYAYHQYAKHRDGGLDKSVVEIVGTSAPVTTCAAPYPDGGHPAVDADELVLAAINNQGDITAGTYPINSFFTLFNPPDGGFGIAVEVHTFVDGGSALRYNANQGSLTISQPDGVSNLTGNFTSQMPVDGGTIDLNGTFNLPYCQP